MGMDWWKKLRTPLKKAWINIATRIGIRDKGLLKLKQDVKRCEYDDVHVMWEMLNYQYEKSDASDIESGLYSPLTTPPPEKKLCSKHCWVRCSPFFCHRF